MALGLSLLPKRSMITFRLRCTSIFLPLSGCSPYTYRLPLSARQDDSRIIRLSSCLVVSQPTTLTPMWFHTHLETNLRAPGHPGTQANTNASPPHHVLANETWTRDVSPLTSKPGPVCRACVSPPGVRRTCPRPSCLSSVASLLHTYALTNGSYRAGVCPQLEWGFL